MVKESLTSTESALFLSDQYDRTFLNIPMGNTNPLEVVFGTTLSRDEENIEEFNSFPKLLIEFTGKQLNKVFGMTIHDYLSLTTFEKNLIIQHADVELAKLAEELERANQQVEQAAKKSKQGFPDE